MISSANPKPYGSNTSANGNGFVDPFNYFVSGDLDNFQKQYGAGTNSSDSGDTTPPPISGPGVIHFPSVDLDIDSNNDGVIATPESFAAIQEDILELNASKGKYVVASTGDMDDDNVPDFADFGPVFGTQLVPMVIRLSDIDQEHASEIKFTFTYDGPTPSELANERTGSGQPGSPFIYTPTPGKPLRIWKHDADERQSINDYISPGTEIDYLTDPNLEVAADGTVTVYVEAASGSLAPLPIETTFVIEGTNWSGELKDAVHVATKEATIAPAAGQKTVTGDEVPSNKEGSRIKHYVSPKADATATKVKLTVPNITNVEWNQLFEWRVNGALKSGVAGSPQTLELSREQTGKFEVVVRDKTTNKESPKMIVWIVWADMSGTVSAPDVHDMPEVDQGDGESPVKTGERTYFTINPTATIQPPSILDQQLDIPDLMGAVTAAEAGLAGNDATGSPLSGGVNAKWDMSRRVATRVLAFPQGVQLIPLDTAIDYPQLDYVGNDDASTNDPEDNNPYAEPNLGKLISYDSVKRQGPGAGSFIGGNLNDEYQVGIWFQDFARVQLAGKWFVISNPLSWRVEFKFRKVEVLETTWNYDTDDDGDIDDHWVEEDDDNLNQDLNQDGNVSGNVNMWVDNGSYSQNDNAGLPE